MALWRKPLQFINVMLANRSPMSVAERGPGRMTYAKKKKKKPFAEHDLRVTLHCAGKKTRSSLSLNLRVMLTMPYNKYRAISSLTLILRSLAGYSCNAQ